MPDLLSFLRSALEEEREINHHGKSRKVKNDEDDDGLVNVSPVGAFDKNLVSVHEQVQDKALKNYYAKVKLTKEKKKTLDRCIFFQKQIKVWIIIIFITIYWISGLNNQ